MNVSHRSNNKLQHPRLVACLLISLLLTSFQSSAADGVIHVPSAYDVSTTLERLQTALKAKGMKIFALIDHQAGGKGVGINIRPTSLLIFGNPKVGTHLMKCAQTAAIDLPMKALVYVNAQGKTILSYNDPNWMGARHAVPNCPIIQKMSKALKHFSKVATQAEPTH